MKILTNDFFYSLILYVLNKVYSCLVIFFTLYAPYLVTIPYTISQISRQNNIIYLTGLSTCSQSISCNPGGTSTRTYNATLGPCNVCGAAAFNYIDALADAIQLISCNVPAASTNIFIRITLPPDIT